MRLLFITSTPLNVTRGSGTFVGIETLMRSVAAKGCQVDLLTPRIHFPVYTIERIFFNETLRFARIDTDASIGFDLDGYALSRKTRAVPHIASIKGVIADEMRYERGLTKATMMVQARCESRNILRADCVITTSHYAASRLKELYGVSKVHCIIPELIDLNQWRDSVSRCSAGPDLSKFIVLCVCRFYPRKRVPLLLDVAEMLRERIPTLQIRLIGGGPESDKLKATCKAKGLTNVVIREDICHSELVQEYCRCHAFCLPSIQEGFGIVFLEAMACGKPIIASRASAIPEVVQHGILTEPDSPREIARAIERLHANPSLRRDLGEAGKEFVQRFDAPLVASAFVDEIRNIVRT